MSSDDGYQDEMDDVEGISETTLDRMFAGRAPADGDTLGLSRFADDLRAAYVAAPATAVEEQHLAAIVADAARLRTGQQKAAPKARAGLAALLPVALMTNGRRKLVLSGFFGSLTAKIIAGTVVATAATGGLAAGNLLPDPVQKLVAAAAGSLGIDLPSPAGTAGHVAATTALTAGQVAKATEVLDALVKQVNDAAILPHQVGLPVAEAAQACATKVATIAGGLAETAAKTTDPRQALSLAHAATAIAQEAVGCAIPKPAEGATIDAGAASVVASTTGAGPLVDAVMDCIDGLKAGIMELAQSAMSSTDPTAAFALATRAGTLADSAGDCAGNVGEAAQTAFALPIPFPSMPKLPAKTPVNVPVPSIPVPVPANALPIPLPVPLPQTGGDTAIPMIPSWWNMVPGMNGTNPAAPWAGMTGSWGDFGQWMPSGAFNPFQPAPSPTG